MDFCGGAFVLFVDFFSFGWVWFVFCFLIGETTWNLLNASCY